MIAMVISVPENIVSAIVVFIAISLTWFAYPAITQPGNVKAALKKSSPVYGAVAIISAIFLVFMLPALQSLVDRKNKIRMEVKARDNAMAQEVKARDNTMAQADQEFATLKDAAMLALETGIPDSWDNARLILSSRRLTDVAKEVLLGANLPEDKLSINEQWYICQNETWGYREGQIALRNMLTPLIDPTKKDALCEFEHTAEALKIEIQDKHRALYHEGKEQRIAARKAVVNFTAKLITTPEQHATWTSVSELMKQITGQISDLEAEIAHQRENRFTTADAQKTIAETERAIAKAEIEWKKMESRHSNRLRRITNE